MDLILHYSITATHTLLCFIHKSRGMMGMPTKSASITHSNIKSPPPPPPTYHIHTYDITSSKSFKRIINSPPTSSIISPRILIPSSIIISQSQSCNCNRSEICGCDTRRTDIIRIMMMVMMIIISVGRDGWTRRTTPITEIFLSTFSSSEA